MDDLFFLGSKDDYEELKAKQRKEQGIVEQAKQESKPTSSHKQVPPVTNDIKAILNRTIIRGDISIVHVKEDIDNIDKFYHNRGETGIDPALYEAARRIKRIYKTYPEYMYAVGVYNEYIQALITKCGSKQILRMQILNGMLEDWLPPTPLYSTSAKDFDMAKEGLLTIPTFEDPDETYNEDLLNQLYPEEFFGDIDPDEYEIVADVEVDPYICKEYDDATPISTNTKTANGRINISDLTELQNMFKTNITGKSNIIEDGDLNSHEEKLSKTPEAIRERYLTKKALTLKPGEFDTLTDDYVEEQDPNRMVKDPISRKTMTAGELRTREVLRMMGHDGGWNEVKLLQMLGVGSKYEIQIMKTKSKNKKKNKKLTDDVVSGLLGGTDLEVYTTDDIQKYLFRD